MKESSRVIKNTIALYMRMGLLAIISIFTVRVTLSVLGETDYGLNNVVNGVVTLSSFITGTMAIAAQRYFSICLKNNDWDGLNRYFSLILNLLFAFIVIVVILFETAGLWFVMNKLVIPPERMFACIAVYEVSLVSFAFSIVSLPFTGLLLADESFGIYSVVSIFEGLVKIIVAYLLYISPFDKLIMLAVMSLIVSFVVNGAYLVYIKRKYCDLKYNVRQNKYGYEEVLSYMNWNLIGAAGSVGKIQVINIIINMFFGGAINAARTLATQVFNIINSFGASFMNAVNPQITKSYAGKEYEKLAKLLQSSSKISFFLLYIVILPFAFNIQYVLRIWLGDSLPDYTIIFMLLMLIDGLIQTITSPIGTAVEATGKVKGYQLTIGILQLMNIPAAYITLQFTLEPIAPFVCSILLSCFMTIGRIFVYKKIDKNFKALEFIKSVFLKIFIVVMLSVGMTVLIMREYSQFYMFAIYVITIVAYTGLLIFIIGLNKEEKVLVKGIVQRALKVSAKG